MADTHNQSIERDKFLTMAINLLHRAFVEAPRTDAKKLYREVAAGKMIALTKVEMEDKTQVRFDVALDHSEYQGTLNFSAFRTSLVTLLGNLANALQQQRDIPSFSAQNQPDNQIIGITGVTLEDEVPAVMVLSVQTHPRKAAVLLRPMYLDYEQFLRSQQQGDSGGAPA